jgi:hypothetical protein
MAGYLIYAFAGHKLFQKGVPILNESQIGIPIFANLLRLLQKPFQILLCDACHDAVPIIPQWLFGVMGISLSSNDARKSLEKLAHL